MWGCSVHNREVFVHLCLYPHTPIRPGRGHELADSGINTDTHPPRPHRHSSDSDVYRLLVSTLRYWWIRRHTATVVLTASVARHHRLLTLHFHWHVDNPVARTGPVESLARSDFGHVHVLATESHGYQVDTSCFDIHLLFPSCGMAGLGKVTLINSTLSSFNSLMASGLATNSPLFWHCVIVHTLTPEWRNCPQLGNRLPIRHVSALCFRAFDLHVLDFNRRTPLAIGVLCAELGQDVNILNLWLCSSFGKFIASSSLTLVHTTGDTLYLMSTTLWTSPLIVEEPDFGRYLSTPPRNHLRSARLSFPSSSLFRTVCVCFSSLVLTASVCSAEPAQRFLFSASFRRTRSGNLLDLDVVNLILRIDCMVWLMRTCLCITAVASSTGGGTKKRSGTKKKRKRDKVSNRSSGQNQKTTNGTKKNNIGTKKKTASGQNKSCKQQSLSSAGPPDPPSQDHPSAGPGLRRTSLRKTPCARPPSAGPPKFRASFFLLRPSFYFFSNFPRSFVELRWSLCNCIIEKVVTTHIWALWTLVKLRPRPHPPGPHPSARHPPAPHPSAPTLRPPPSNPSPSNPHPPTPYPSAPTFSISGPPTLPLPLPFHPAHLDPCCLSRLSFSILSQMSFFFCPDNRLLTLSRFRFFVPLRFFCPA